MHAPGASTPRPRWRPWRRLALLLALAAAVAGPPAAGWAYWTGFESSLGGTGVAGAASVSHGTVPRVETAGAPNVVMTWGGSTLSNGLPVAGYVIRRYDADTGAEQPVGPGCSGTIATPTCTEVSVPAGTWRYTVTPLFAGHWRGIEGGQSGTVTTGAATLTLDKNLFGPPLPTQTTGTVAGFAAGEAIGYTIDGADIAGSPPNAGADGTAAITALTIPATTEGPHTVKVVGAQSGVVATAGILIDTFGPELSAFVTPAPNAAGWNRTPVTVTGTLDDRGGSALSFVKYTDDGSDPRTSPTAMPYAGVPIAVDRTTTAKYYGADAAGNTLTVQTLEVKIDTIPPAGLPEMVEVTGGAFIVFTPGHEYDRSYYRGAAAGSYRVKLTVFDEGGSGPASFGTSEITGDSVGFTHEPGVVTTPVGGPFLTNPTSWVAGASGTPTSTFTLTDVAGNTLVGLGSILNDSTAPAGGSVDAAGLAGTGGRYATWTALSMVLSPGTDAQSQLADGGARLLRGSAPLDSANGVVDGVCGTFGASAQVGADDPAPGVTDPVPADGCYRYEYAVPDHVGNIATFMSPVIKVQATAPPSLAPAAVQLTPVTGLTAQLVSGSTVYYKPAQAGSFRVQASASDARSGIAQVLFPALWGFSGGGASTTPTAGTTFRTTYIWSGNAASASPGPQALTATDNAGLALASATAFSVVKDAAGPVHALTITGATGAYLDADRLYYNGNTAGAFQFVHALTDDASGPASVAYPSIARTGWSHSAQTVTTPAGGPYASTTFSWTANPLTPSTYTITGADRLATASTAPITFTRDSTPPSGGSVSYPNGTVKTLSVAVTTAGGSDAGSGVKPAGVVTRDQASLNLGNGSCGSFPGTFATTVTLAGGADTSVVTARCYRYRYTASDNVGNQTTYSSVSTAKVDTRP